MRKIERELYQYPGVTEVLTQTNLIDDINKNKELAAGTFAVLALLFIVIAFFLINGTIRLSIYSKRFLIRSMQLVGATEGFIIKPFLKKAIFFNTPFLVLLKKASTTLRWYLNIPAEIE